MSEGGTALVYLTVPDPDGQLLARAKAALTGIEGIDTIVEPVRLRVIRAAVHRRERSDGRVDADRKRRVLLLHGRAW